MLRLTDHYSLSPCSRVIAVSLQGTKVFETVAVPGVQAGAPQTSSDGRYLYINSNVGGNEGHFSVFDTTKATNGTVPAMYSYVAPPIANSTNSTTNPFSPLGVFHNPIEGYYDGGAGNTNDIFIWCDDTPVGQTTPGSGNIYIFQQSMNSTAAQVVVAGKPRSFQSPNPPTIANRGLSMFWSVVRAEERSWNGQPGLVSSYFSRTLVSKTSLNRGTPSYVAAKASPTVYGTDAMPTLYGPGASNQVFKSDFNFTNVIVVNTSSLVSNKVLVSPDGKKIYWASQDGKLVQASSSDLSQVWSVLYTSPIFGAIAQSDDGTMIFAADSSGVLNAYQVAQTNASSAPTTVPLIPKPTMGPGMRKSMIPSSAGHSHAPSVIKAHAPAGASPTTTKKSGASSVLVATAVVCMLAAALV
jgi:hypothetical protein